MASTFLMTRTTFSSSFISSALFCSRPAVSTSSTSSFCSFAAVSALKARLAESEPCAPAMTGDLVRSPQTFSCSIAAARNVSPAASITLRPSALNFARELADGGGLAGAVDADHEDDERLLRRVDLERLRHRRQHLLDLGRDHRFDVIGRDRLVVAAGADGVRDAHRDFGAEIGAQQHILDIVEHGAVELALGDEVGNGRSRANSRFASGRSKAAATSSAWGFREWYRSCWGCVSGFAP